MKEPSHIKLNERYDVEALIGSPPGWALRWGLTTMLAVLALLVWVAHFVQYPDVVEARAVLTTANPPIRLAANATAKISKLNVENGTMVKAGDVLAVLENPAKLQDVVLLDSMLQKIAEDPSLLEFNLPNVPQLGRLQANYADFSNRLKELRYFLSKDINYLKISNLRKQMNEIESLNKSLSRQENILVKEVELAKKNYERDSSLFGINSLSKLEFEKSESDWLAKRRELEVLRSNSANYNLRVQEMQAQVLDLQQVQYDGESQKLLDFRLEVQRLKGEIDAWKHDFLLVAPVSGEIALTKAWSENQQVQAGTEVLTLVPKVGAGEWLAKASLSSNRSGKVKVGMPVHIRLDGYPYQEFGVLNGEVRRISIVPGEQGYEVEIDLQNGLKTSHGTKVDFRQETQGLARIITEKRSLLDRLLARITSAFEDN